MLSFTTRTLAALALGAAASLAQAQAPIKIGFMAELSGPQGALGQDQYDAFMMVVERNGGKLGGVPVQVLRPATSCTATGSRPADWSPASAGSAGSSA